jgi:hypothetical protein
VSREYGWTDDQILDLPVRRFRQIVAAIRRRQFLRRREEIQLMSWQTRQITTFTAGGYMVDSKKGNPAFHYAQNLAFDEIEEAQLEEAQLRAARNGELIYEKDEEGKTVLDPRGMPVVAEIVPAQSHMNSDFDVMSAFGDPSKWKARG